MKMRLLQWCPWLQQMSCSHHRPITNQEKRYTAWQEACRKDIERAFGVLKTTWQCVDRPIHLYHLDDIADRIACCLVLHNMLVTDRVMDGENYNYRKRYDPASRMGTEEVVVPEPPNLVAVQGRRDK
jgi:hypothetical protein